MRQLLVLLLFFFSTLSLANDVNELAELLADKNTIEANFEQISLTATGERTQVQTGTMSIARPNKFRWQVKEPLAQLIVGDGIDVYIYDELLEQVTITSLDPQKIDTPVLLLSGDPKNIEDSFDVFGIEFGETKEFKLTPKAQDDIFDSIILRFVNDTLTELEMIDSFGQRSIVIFTNSRINQTISDDTFKFIIPDKVDVFHSESL